MDELFGQQMRLCFCTHGDIYESSKVSDDERIDETSKIKNLTQPKRE